ncbi:M16 family metallopeptidase [Streptomyces sp. NPDC057623]|uniref:M16 family metallopeptidase n=1 Tax=Streptomyces sp. NPDC057623 TaxID=3346187 RepID=UPI0036A4D95A
MPTAGQTPSTVAERIRPPVVSVLDPSLETTSICLSVGYGARLDPRGRCGVAHLLEHLLFSLPKAGRPSFAEWVERRGGTTNAETGLETMLFHAQVAAEDAPETLAMMLDCVLEPAFDAQVFETEREVVVKEMVTAAADPSDLVQDVVFEKLFPGHPIGRPIGGRIEELQELTAAAVEEEHRTRFLNGPKALVVVGPRPVDGLDDLLDTFAPHDAAAAIVPSLPLPAPDLTPPGPSGPDFAWTCFAGRSTSLEAADKEAYTVLATLLGSSPSSLLYRKLRVEEALSYAFEAWNRSYTECGVWRLLVGVEPQAVGRLVDIVEGLLADLAEGRLPEEELAVARRKAEMRLVTQAEMPLERARLTALGIRGGSADWSLEQARAALRAVTPEQIARAAGSLRGNLAVAVRPEAA